MTLKPVFASRTAGAGYTGREWTVQRAGAHELAVVVEVHIRRGRAGCAFTGIDHDVFPVRRPVQHKKRPAADTG